MSTQPRPATPALIDTFGRTARDLRVSLTEKCSLRCTYCMPEEGLPLVPEQSRMTTDEVVRLVAIAHHQLGVHQVRFTGGEPLLRADLEEIIQRTRTECPELPIALTTNAVGLEHRAASLAAAGLNRVNISLDTVNRLAFARLTRRDRLPSVLQGVQAAWAVGLHPIKINAVPLRSTLSGVVELLQWALDKGVQLRFIEQMPLDADHTWDRNDMVTAAEILAELTGTFDLEPAGRDDPSAPAELWTVNGYWDATGTPATVGIIGTVTRTFCTACDRTRLTAEGTVRSCLFSDDETSLLKPLRTGADDTEIADLWRAAMWGKSAGHGIDDGLFRRTQRTMGAIGG